MAPGCLQEHLLRSVLKCRIKPFEKALVESFLLTIRLLGSFYCIRILSTLVFCKRAVEVFTKARFSNDEIAEILHQTDKLSALIRLNVLIWMGLAGKSIRRILIMVWHLFAFPTPLNNCKVCKWTIKIDAFIWQTTSCSHFWWIIDESLGYLFATGCPLDSVSRRGDNESGTISEQYQKIIPKIQDLFSEESSGTEKLTWAT